MSYWTAVPLPALPRHLKPACHAVAFKRRRDTRKLKLFINVLNENRCKIFTSTIIIAKFIVVISYRIFSKYR